MLPLLLPSVPASPVQLAFQWMLVNNLPFLLKRERNKSCQCMYRKNTAVVKTTSLFMQLYSIFRVLWYSIDVIPCVASYTM